MDKKNYRESLEKDRQEINAESTSNLSRRAYRQPGNQKPPKRRNVLLPSLFFIFILIPVTVLIYVAFFYVPDDTLIGAKNENEVSFETAEPSEASTVIVPEEAEEEEAEEVEESVETETDAKEEEEVEEPVQPEPVEEEKVEVETDKPEDANVTPVQTPAPAVETQEPAETVRTVVVKENETLYRIAVNNYGASGAGAAVERIKQANNLGSNEIYPGQTLILP